MMTAQIEPWKSFIKEAQPILPLHWQELALDKDVIPLDPEYSVYDARDERGEVLVSTVRNDGILIGYFIGFVSPGLHYRTCLTMVMDILYVHPNHRGGGAGLMLLRCAEAEAERRGVQRIFLGTKIHLDISAIFVRLNYRPVEHYYSKLISANVPRGTGEK